MYNRKIKTGGKAQRKSQGRANMIYLSYLDLCLASQLKFVAKIEFPQDLYSALVDVDSVSCVKQTVRWEAHRRKKSSSWLCGSLEKLEFFLPTTTCISAKALWNTHADHRTPCERRCSPCRQTDSSEALWVRPPRLHRDLEQKHTNTVSLNHIMPSVEVYFIR